MTLYRIIVLVGAAVLTAAIIWAMGADVRGLGPVLAEMTSEPWTLVTLIDLYLGFALSAVIVVLFERSWRARLIWAAPIFILGNVWTALWVVWRLPELARRLRSA